MNSHDAGNLLILIGLVMGVFTDAKSGWSIFLIWLGWVMLP